MITYYFTSLLCVTIISTLLLVVVANIGENDDRKRNIQR